MLLGMVRQPLRWFYVWALLVWLFVVWVGYQSLTPSPIQTPGLPYGDKLGHFSAYFLMMAGFAQLYQRASHRMPLVLLVLYGIAMEFLQSMTGYRYFEYADMAANTLGALVAWCLAAPRFTFAQWLLRCERLIGN